MFLLTNQFGEFLIIAIVAVLVIAIGLLIYYIVTGKKEKEETNINPNFETRNENLEQKIPESNNQNYTNNSYSNQVNSQINTEVQSNNQIVEPIIPKTDVKVSSEEEKALEDAKTDSNIQALLDQMQKDLDKSSEDYAESIARYEDDEEANAIISYKELMKYKESHDKDIVLEDKNKEELKEVIKEKESEESKEEVKKFKRSEFISPIFGYNEETNVTYREIKRPPRKEIRVPNSEEEWESDRILRNLENDTAEVIEFENSKGEIKEEIDKNDNFLDALVDFRNKLN